MHCTQMSVASGGSHTVQQLIVVFSGCAHAPWNRAKPPGARQGVTLACLAPGGSPSLHFPDKVLQLVKHSSQDHSDTQNSILG